MLKGFQFHHIGYVTQSIADTSFIYCSAGYQASEVIEDTIQQTKVCFLTKENNPCIELIEPVDENSSVNKILKNNKGATPYHICYEVDDIDEVFTEMTELGYTPLFRPVEAAAFGNRQIAYFYKKEIGFIETVSRI
jgi:methylmalonyl-CoA/ethylmalonyl-CoA epimerase